jgi:NAD-dependent SIR2 family protein deacetylase
MEAPKTKVVLFLGAGFSVPSGYPCTAQLNKTLLETPAERRDVRVEQFITATIRKFWETVFAWRSGMREPSFEDHFTQIDMAVNSGHNFGPDYDSAKLRAIHKMTIHRIFGWLRKPKGLPDYDAAGLVVRLSRTFEVTIITTNWDTHVEWILNAEGPGLPFNYGVGEATPDGKPVEREGDISLLKLHGCVNMSYCDCCQQWTRLGYGSLQAAVDMELLLDSRDFRLLGADAAVADLLKRDQLHERLAS